MNKLQILSGFAVSVIPDGSRMTGVWGGAGQGAQCCETLP